MALALPWLILAAVIVVVGAIIAGLVVGYRSTVSPTAEGVGIARAERLRGLDSVTSAVRRRLLVVALFTVLLVVASLSAGVVAARPQSAETIQPVSTSRDIMLCLDVSGSMTEVDVEVLDVFQELVPSFEGERIGLVIFNSSPVQVFPLTDDYTLIEERLASMKESFDYIDYIPEHWVGTLNGPGASLIGDGLAACALSFDRPDDERTRAIVLATDNYVAGDSTVTLPEAAAYASSLGVRVFALNPFQDESAESLELIAAAESTGGQSYGLRDTTTVGDIVADVQEQAATELIGEAQVVWNDTPELWIVIVLVAVLGATLIAWRARL